MFRGYETCFILHTSLS